MDGLERLRIFARVAALASFSAAARELRLAQSQVSRAVRALEDDVGVVLLTRTTRAVALTLEGRRYLDGVRGALGMLAAADAALKQSRAEPAGVLRLTAPPELAEVVGEAVAALILRHPALEIEASFDNRVVDLAAEGYEVALRSGALDASSPELRVHKLGATRAIICAAPSYLAKRAEPRSPADLADHEVAVFTRKPRAEVQLQHADGRRARVKLTGRIRVDDLRAVRAAAVAGAALALLPEAQAAPQLALGHLVRVLPRWATAAIPIHALLLARSPQPPRVTVLVEALRVAFGARALLRAR